MSTDTIVQIKLFQFSGKDDLQLQRLKKTDLQYNLQSPSLKIINGLFPPSSKVIRFTPCL